MLPFRNRPDDYEESIDERNNQNDPPLPIAGVDFSDTESVANSYNSGGSDGGRREQSNDEDDDRLLVRSTISRDTTNNNGGADIVDLSKISANNNEFLSAGRYRSEIVEIIDERNPTLQYQHASPPPSPPLPRAPRRTYSIDSLGPLMSSDESDSDVPQDADVPVGPLASVYMSEGIPPHPHSTSILAKAMPGTNLHQLYRKALPEQSRLDTYNWRAQLRIPTRRKSESDLGPRRETNDKSPLSQHLLPSSSKRELVQAWKFAGTEFGHKRDAVGTRRRVGEQSHRALGVTLAQTAESHLGLNLYDDSAQSLFYRHLIDTIEGLRSERNFLASLLTTPQETPPPPAPVKKPEPKPIPVQKATPKLKTLYRVFCKSPQHSHDQAIYEDLPVRRFSKRSQDLKLSGKDIVRNLGHYCSQNPEISIIIFKEHLCVEDTAPRTLWRTYQRRARSGAEISPRSERLCIVSESLQKALDHVALCAAPESRVSARGMREMSAPYLFLYQHRALLIEYEKEISGPMKENLSLLLEFIQSGYDEEYREAETEFAAGILTEKHMEKLFRPNEIVVDNSGDHLVAYVVNRWPELEDEEMKLYCWSWHYDGRFLHRQDTTLSISLPLSEDFTIDQLPFCPISKVDVKLLEALRKRGRKFWSMKGQYFGCFSGSDSSGTMHHHHIRVVVDMATYTKMHSSKFIGLPPNRSRFDPWPVQIPRESDPDDSMIMLLPPTVFGFVLQEKSWLKLAINGIHPIEWNKRAFDRLVLEPRTKELITALVEVRIATGRTEDIIEGKGNGLMILLHGSPGTGKTLTAESVAEIAEKPLYRVTCGDIGTRADDVERYLQTVLFLGKIWNCVLLLDEADVFLEERSIADLERNSLVSVFLRILEYYDGILIMTSNRVGTFDEAFKSRIQVSLHYEDLTKKSRRTIWNNFIVMLEEAGEDVNISDLESHLEEMASEEMNGRQIRNAMTTARQLALHRKERLHWEHLDQVLKTAREFNRYLKNVQGHTDKQWAREQRLR